jgi:hypothetical protein
MAIVKTRWRLTNHPLIAWKNTCTSDAIIAKNISSAAATMEFVIDFRYERKNCRFRAVFRSDAAAQRACSGPGTMDIFTRRL